MAKMKFTDDKIAKLKSESGELLDVWDKQMPGLGARVAASGRKTFVLVARYPGAANPTRRRLGDAAVMTVDEAREKARGWLKLIAAHIDPAIEEERQRLAQAERRANTFAAVAEDFIAEKLPGERKGREVERDIRGEFIPAWGPLPIADVTDLHVLAVINAAKKRGSPAQARNLLGIAKRLFAWAVDQRVYGLIASPAAGLKPTKIIGEKASDNRTLDDAEFFAFWRAVTRMPYPYGPVYQLLALTALRLNEVADARWTEFDFANRLWTIPAARMKGKESKARAHVVPLTDDVLKILGTLPLFKSGDFLFSTTFGAKPVWMSDKIKKQVDARMLRTLRALARKRGDHVAETKLAKWKNHDIRRTVRSNLARLRIPEAAAEAVMAHVRPGIVGVYDQHAYEDEKREALMMWAARLRSIVSPTPDNVLPLRASA